MLRTTCLLLATALTTAACAEAPSADPGAGGDTGGKADGAVTTLTFDAGFGETSDGPLVSGTTIRVDYDLDRMTTCRGSSGGSEAWGVTGFAAFDGGEPVAFAVSRIESGRVVPVVARVDLPADASHVDLWFQISDRFGCTAFDSNDGVNYGFALERRGDGGTTVLDFGADFSELQSDAIHAGDRVVVHYDPQRLATCEGSTGGHAAWGVTGYYQIDGGAVTTLQVAQADGSVLVPADPSFTVPDGRRITMWFDATNIWGCHAWDSNLGANYEFAIE